MSRGFFAWHRPGPDRLLSSWFLAAVPGNKLIRAWERLLRAYWSRRKTPVHYYVIHYLFEWMLMREPEMARRWAAIPSLSADPPHALMQRLRRDPADFGDLGAAPVHKLNWRRTVDLEGLARRMQEGAAR